MNNSQKILKMISGFIEAGILTSQDLKKELDTSIKFQKDKFAGKMDLVTRKEFEILKKLIEKQPKEINKIKKKNQKGNEILTIRPLCLLSDKAIPPPCDFAISWATDKPKPTPDLFKPLLLSTL